MSGNIIYTYFELFRYFLDMPIAKKKKKSIMHYHVIEQKTPKPIQPDFEGDCIIIPTTRIAYYLLQLWTILYVYNT